MENINEFFVRVSSKTLIDQKLEIGQEVKLEIVGEVVKTETLSRQEELCDYVAIVKPLKVEIIYKIKL